MGEINEWIDALRSVGASLIERLRETSSEVVEGARRLVQRVVELVIGERYDEAGSEIRGFWERTKGELLRTFTEFQDQVLTIADAVLGLQLESVEQLVVGIGIALEVAIEFVSTYPAECLMIVGGVVETVLLAASGNIPGAVMVGVQTSVLGARLVTKVLEQTPDQAEREVLKARYPIPGPIETIAMRFEDKEPNEIIDAFDRAREQMPDYVRSRIPGDASNQTLSDELKDYAHLDDFEE